MTIMLRYYIVLTLTCVTIHKDDVDLVFWICWVIGKMEYTNLNKTLVIRDLKIRAAYAAIHVQIE